MNIVILGGGTAGWMTALYVQQAYSKSLQPRHNITVVESDDIGILGAGEGTTPHFPTFLKTVGLDIADIIKNCRATVKHGIRFTNWNGDGTSFVHSFGCAEECNPIKSNAYVKHIADGHTLNDISYAEKLLSSKRVDIRAEKAAAGTALIPNYNSNIALHFDASALATYFKKVAMERGVARVEGMLHRIESDSRSHIKKIHLKNGKMVDVDFVFDCSGFAKLLIGKHFNTEWISYSKYLPMKSAVPFFLDHDGDVAPETEAIAMKYGWMWKIPVDTRYGCGYVFDSDYISDEEALREAEEYFNVKLESPKTFTFRPGMHKDTLVKNCMAVGLSQSFVEPLEATSIWVSILNLESFVMSNGLDIYAYDSWAKDFNEECGRRNSQIVEFLQLHYLTKRADSPFWKEFRMKNEMHPHLEYKLKIVAEHLFADPSCVIKGSEHFSMQSWVEVAAGLELVDVQSYKKFIEQFSKDKWYYADQNKERLLGTQDHLIQQCMFHKDFIQKIKTVC